MGMMEADFVQARDSVPAMAQLATYAGGALWESFNRQMQARYQAAPVLSFSGCSMQPGWNVKYRKSGKSLCTLYPMPGYFLVLVVMGEKEMPGAERLIAQCTPHVQDIFRRTNTGQGQKWLMIDVRDEEAVADVLALIALRRKPA